MGRSVAQERVCTYLRFSSSAGRWRYECDLFDKKFVEKDESRRYGGMYFTAKFRNLHFDIASKKAAYGIMIQNKVRMEMPRLSFPQVRSYLSNLRRNFFYVTRSNYNARDFIHFFER